MGIWKYCISSHGKDPFRAGDSKSWFEYYKRGNGITSVPVDRELGPGDHIWFFVDGRPVAGAAILKVDYNICWNCYEAYYDSDNMLLEEDAPKSRMDMPAVETRVEEIWKYHQS